MTVTRLPERNLDVLRAMAVISVSAHHFAIAIGETTHVLVPYWIGRIGVLAFFVHTSLVLMSSLERTKTKPDWLSAFYLRRAFRIYPLAIVMVLLVAAVRMPPRVPRPGIAQQFVPPDATTLLSNLALIQNITQRHGLLVVLWTLPLEVQMYCLLPALFLLARRGVGAIMVALVAACAALPLIQANVAPGAWRLRQLAEVAPCFVCGVLAFAILKHRRSTWRFPAWLWWVLYPASAVLMRQLALPTASYLAEWVYALGIAVAIPWVATLPPSRGTRLGALIAKYSYSIYLVHVPVLWVGRVVCRGFPPSIQWTLIAGMMWAVPWVFYHGVEAPGIALGKRVVSGPGLRAASAPAP